MKTVPVATQNPNYGWVDRFSIAHASTGALLGFTSIPLWGVLVGAVLFEFAEPVMQATFPQWRLSSTRETTQNSIVDVALAVVVCWLVRKVP